MKPTWKVIITSSEAALPAQFVRTLSTIDVTEHERKVPNPLSATKEEAVLRLHTGRAEWEDVAVQGIALAAAKRYDFTWATLLKDAHAAVILLPAGSAAALEDVRRLTKLFARLDLVACLIGVTGAVDGDAAVATVQAALDSTYPVVLCRPEDAADVQSTIRAVAGLIQPPAASTPQDSL